VYLLDEQLIADVRGDMLSACALNSFGYPGKFAFNLKRSQKKHTVVSGRRRWRVQFDGQVLPVLVLAQVELIRGPEHGALLSDTAKELLFKS
jgi:hypothetical protein